MKKLYDGRCNTNHIIWIILKPCKKKSSKLFSAQSLIYDLKSEQCSNIIIINTAWKIAWRLHSV